MGEIPKMALARAILCFQFYVQDDELLPVYHPGRWTRFLSAPFNIAVVLASDLYAGNRCVVLNRESSFTLSATRTFIRTHVAQVKELLPAVPYPQPNCGLIQ